VKELDDLLARLPSAQSITFEGRAISRDNDNLHLAIASGVIAIPLTEIANVQVLTGQPNDIVSVDVRNADRIKQIRNAGPNPLNRIGGGFGGGLGGGLGGVFGNFGSTFSNGRYVDSATVSQGVADATDDTWWAVEADDIQV